MVIQIAFVICSFSILSYYESQGTHLGNSINIAGKNRFLTSNLLLQISEYFSQEGNNSDQSKIRSAMNQLESNILALKQGGMISDIDLRPLPPMFVELEAHNFPSPSLSNPPIPHPGSLAAVYETLTKVNLF